MTNMSAAILTLSALGFGFAGGLSYSSGQANAVVVAAPSMTPVEYFPARFENQAKEEEPLPPQF